jgi:small subunit ribosomal protein S19e
MMRIGSSSGAPPWPGTCTSGWYMSAFVLFFSTLSFTRSPVGVSTIRKIYGIRSNNGSSPSHWARGNGGVARKALQALEGLKLAEKDPNGGRRLTSQGRRDLDRIAAQLKAKKAEALAAQAAAVIATE